MNTFLTVLVIILSSILSFLMGYAYRRHQEEKMKKRVWNNIVKRLHVIPPIHFDPIKPESTTKKEDFDLVDELMYEHPKNWGEDEILLDIVRAFRRYQPDLIVNRFDHRTPGSTHGHHTASAILSIDAFNKANDPNYDPDSVLKYGTWQPKRLVFNTSWWFYGGREAFEKADKSNLLTLSIGKYYPHLGQSNGEIAALSRSMHKSQGFGSLSSRDQQIEYLELILGEMPSNKNDIFDGIDRNWSRIGVDPDDPLIHKINGILDSFDFKNPAKHASDLLEILNRLQSLPKTPRVEEKIYRV